MKKTIKTEKNGFKICKGTKVYVSSGTYYRSPPRKEVIELVKNIWNNDPSIKKLRKHIKHITIKSIYTSKRKLTIGTWNTPNKKLIIRDHEGVPISSYKMVIYHEVKGHAFWEWAKKYRPEELKKFNDFVSKLRPINRYVRDNESYWKTLEYSDGTTMYQDEQHSAAVEFAENVDVDTGDYHKCRLNSEEKEQLLKLYNQLHY